jgi:hypothetical protein
MKKHLLALSMLVLSITAFAGTVTDPAIMGRWISSTPVYAANGISIFMAFNFSDSNVAMSSICRYANGQELEASVTVPVSVAANKINVQGAGHSENKSGGMNCNVDVQVGSVDYAIVGANLRLSAGGRALDFNRR